jgi:hypothetical protein
MNNQLQYVNELLCTNKLSLNADKSSSVIFHPPHKKRNYPFKLLIRGEVIEKKKSANYLGVIIDSNLNWKAHVQDLSKKLARSIGVLSKLRHFVPTSILFQLYYSIIFHF